MQRHNQGTWVTMLQRTRLVTIRLSDTEFSQVQEQCRKEEARSLSEFARAAVMQRVQLSGSADCGFVTDLSSLNIRLRELDVALKELRNRIARLLGEPLEGTNPQIGNAGLSS